MSSGPDATAHEVGYDAHKRIDCLEKKLSELEERVKELEQSAWPVK